MSSGSFGGGDFANLRMREAHSDDIEVRDIDREVALKGAYGKLREDEIAAQLEVGADKETATATVSPSSPG